MFLRKAPSGEYLEGNAPNDMLLWDGNEWQPGQINGWIPGPTNWNQIFVSTGINMGAWVPQTIYAFGPARTDGGDDATRWNAFLALIPDNSKVVWIRDTYHFKTPGNLRSRIVIDGNNSIIVSTITPGGLGSITQCPFFTSEPATLTGATTLHLANTVGTAVVNSVADVPIGTTIRLASVGVAHQRMYFRVIDNAAGGGGFNLTLDRAVKRQFAPADLVQPCRTWDDIHIENFTLTGTGDRLIEIVAGLRCYTRNIKLLPSSGMVSDIAMSFDLGCYDCWGIDPFARGDGAPSSCHGIALEGAESSGYVRADVARFPNYAQITLLGTIDCVLDHCKGHDSGSVTANGLALTSDLAALPCLNTTIVGGGYYSNAASNINIANAIGTRFFGSDASYCSSAGGAGVLLSPLGGGVVDKTEFFGLTANGCTNDGIIVASGVTRTNFKGGSAENNTNVGLSIASANVSLEGFGFKNNVVGDITTSGACVVTFVDLEIGSATASWVGITTSSTTRVKGKNLTIHHNAASQYGVINYGVFEVDGVDADGTNIATATVYYGQNNSSLRRKGEFKTTGGTPITGGGSAKYNIGQIALTGAAAVTYSFPDITALDPIQVRTTALGGTPSDYQAVPSAGVGVILTAVALNTSTVEVTIG
jgi:hypothetical protein